MQSGLIVESLCYMSPNTAEFYCIVPLLPFLLDLVTYYTLL